MSLKKVNTNRVVITGMGLVTAIGQDLFKFWANLNSGVQGTSEIKSFSTQGYSSSIGGEIHDFNFPEDMLSNSIGGRAAQFAIVAANNALSDANIKDLSKFKSSIVIGTTLGESQEIEAIDSQFLDDPTNISSADFLRASTDSISQSVANYFSSSGMNCVISNACAAGNFSLAYGFELLKSGLVDVVLAGGSESMSKIAFTGFSRIFSLSPDKCQPFDKNRAGIIVAEGSGVLILETEEHARKRGAKIICEFLGYGMSSDASSMMVPNVEGIALSMNRALQKSKLNINEIDWICAHGTGTVANDVAESRAINDIFGKNSSVIVTSIKSSLGHAMGAASAIESITCALSIREKEIPPTSNLISQDNDCDIRCIKQSKKQDVRVVINNSSAFGGNNCATVFGAPTND